MGEGWGANLSQKHQGTRGIGDTVKVVLGLIFPKELVANKCLASREKPEDLHLRKS